MFDEQTDASADNQNIDNKNRLSDGFIISPFNTDDYKIIRLYADIELEALPEQTPGGYISLFPGRSTTKEEHAEEIQAIKKQIDEYPEQLANRAKIVAARVKLQEGNINPEKTFTQLCKDYPDAFVFCYYTPHTGLWTGASPELLLSREAGAVHTMSLAGTRDANTPEEWDQKNIYEQKTVTDFIAGELTTLGYNVEIGERYTKKAGKIEHLCTPITIREERLTRRDIEKIADRLSPTPALSGYPREEALKIIGRKENFERGYYGGYCGPFRGDDKISLYVNLRSGCFIPGWMALYAGGGITRYSEIENEWQETEKKLQTLANSLS